MFWIIVQLEFLFDPAWLPKKSLHWRTRECPGSHEPWMRADVFFYGLKGKIIEFQTNRFLLLTRIKVDLELMFRVWVDDDSAWEIHQNSLSN